MSPTRDAFSTARDPAHQQPADSGGERDDCRNQDGTTNGVKLMARLSGLSEAEIAWTWNRMKELRGQGMSADEAKAQIKTECASRPWEQSNG